MRRARIVSWTRKNALKKRNCEGRSIYLLRFVARPHFEDSNRMSETTRGMLQECRARVRHKQARLDQPRFRQSRHAPGKYYRLERLADAYKKGPNQGPFSTIWSG